MLEIVLPSEEAYDAERELFIPLDSVVLRFEHSLISVSKWESKYKKAFLFEDKDNPKTLDEMKYYMYCMLLDDHPESIIGRLKNEHYLKLKEYIEDSHTATTISKQPVNNSVRKEIITSELIYYWMVALQVPFEAQYWNLNRLIMLIQVINHKNTPPKKQSSKNIAAQRRALNAQRRQQYGTAG